MSAAHRGWSAGNGLFSKTAYCVSLGGRTKARAWFDCSPPNGMHIATVMRQPTDKVFRECGIYIYTLWFCAQVTWPSPFRTPWISGTRRTELDGYVDTAAHISCLDKFHRIQQSCCLYEGIAYENSKSKNPFIQPFLYPSLIRAEFTWCLTQAAFAVWLM